MGLLDLLCPHSSLGVKYMTIISNTEREKKANGNIEVATEQV